MTDVMTGGAKPTVYLVDDDPGMLKSMVRMMEVAHLAARGYASADAFLAGYDDTRAGCLVVDMRMPGMSGVELLEHLQRRKIALPVIVITGHGDIPTAVRTMKLGASEFLEKPFDPRLLVEKVRELLSSDSVRRDRDREMRLVRDRLSALTPREEEVVKWLVAGLSNKQIAREMDISIKTVEHHRAHIMTKTAALNSADLVRVWVLAGKA